MEKKLKEKILFLLIFASLFFVFACSPPATQTLSSSETISATRLPETPTQSLGVISPTLLIVATLAPTPSSTPIPTATYAQPNGCVRPPDDYSRIEINGMQINQRTFSMLQNAQALYSGELDLTGYHLTQGSYSTSVSASFGTHAGGGAVDLSVIQYGTYQVLYDDIPRVISALRIAGFAAWLRDFDQLYPGSPIHIHAIAIGDAELSQAAQEQLTGMYGYLLGFNGLPQPDGADPIKDEHDRPVLCQWMLDAGYELLPESQP